MGRASRKSTGTAGVSPGRGHWTETHPDRELWTPHQRALAESMTQGAYEAVYGRGEPVETEEDGRYEDMIASEREALRELSDAQLLQKVAENEALLGDQDRAVLQFGDTLHNPDKNNREYRIIIRLVRDEISGEYQYESRSEWGRQGQVGSQSKVIQRSSHITDVLLPANRRISEKRAGGYTESSGSDGRLRLRTIRDSLIEKLLSQY